MPNKSNYFKKDREENRSPRKRMKLRPINISVSINQGLTDKDNVYAKGRYDYSYLAKYERSVDISKRHEYHIRNIKSRAAIKGLDFDLDAQLIDWPEYCPLLGVKLNYNAERNDPASPSIDRIDPAKGYLKNNVWVISTKANTMKNNASLQELQLFCHNIQKRLISTYITLGLLSPLPQENS